MPTIKETIQKVSEFAELPEGWHFGEGLSPSQERIDQAVGFLEYTHLSNLERVNAFPGIRGQVEVTFYSGDRMLEITIEADDSITIAEDRDREQISFEENLSQSDAYQRLEEFSQSVWAFSDHFTESIMTQSVRAAVSQVVPWISEAESRCLLSTWNARRGRAVQYVHILPGITTSRPVTLRSTGDYVTGLYHALAESYLREPQMVTTATGTFTIGARKPPEECLNV